MEENNNSELNQEIADAEHEEVHDKEATEKEMIKVYLEDKKEIKKEIEKKLKETNIIVEENIYTKKG